MLENISTDLLWSLNESPSEKEGKSYTFRTSESKEEPSMKVPPKRKGNVHVWTSFHCECTLPSMKVPPKRKGNVCLRMA